MLQELREYARKRGNLPGQQTIDRMIQRVESGKISERDLLVYAVQILEYWEEYRFGEAVHLEITRRRDLLARLNDIIKTAILRTDAIALTRAQDDKKILLNLPDTTRQLDQETIDLTAEAMKIKKNHPYWPWVRVATEITGNPSDAERLKKAVQRTRKALEKTGKTIP